MSTIHVAMQSFQSLLIEMHFNTQQLATGTAFIVKEGDKFFLITNRHNVTGRHQETDKPLSEKCSIPNCIRVYHTMRDELGSWDYKDYSLYKEDETPIWHEHPTFGSKADFIALEIHEDEKFSFYPYDLSSPTNADVIPIGIAETIRVVGFPFGLTGGGALAIWATGHIATEPGIDYNELPIFLIDCRSRQGQSGSPVLFYEHSPIRMQQNGTSAIHTGIRTKLLGIYSGRINTESDLGMVWKLSAIKELVQSI